MTILCIAVICRLVTIDVARSISFDSIRCQRPRPFLPSCVSAWLAVCAHKRGACQKKDSDVASAFNYSFSHRVDPGIAGKCS